MANKVGPLIKEARTAAGLSQEALAKKIEGLSSGDVGKAERGEKELTQDQLKAIAKATGVTQKSLLEAAKASTYGTAKTSTSKPAAKNDFELTSAEKKLVELYRAADSETKKAAVKLLKGEKETGGELLNTILGAMELFTKEK